MKRARHIAASLLVGLVWSGADVVAQPDPEGWEDALFQRGVVLRFTPTFTLANAGVDTNVLYEAEDPIDDIVFTLRPGVDYWLRFGPILMSATSSLDYHYFRESTDQRNLGTEQALRVDLSLTRFTPFVYTQFLDRRERLGVEIDARAPWRRKALGAGIEFRIQSRTTLTLSGQQSHLDYEEGAEFRDVLLGPQLNRTSRSVELEFGYELTPLTTVQARVQRERETFDSSMLRHANSWTLAADFEFDPLAFISGDFQFGVRKFDLEAPLLQDFSGLVMSGRLSYTFYRATLAVTLGRDTQFSYLESDPYYVQTGFGASVSQVLTPLWDVVGRTGRQRLDYRSQWLSVRDVALVPRWNQEGDVRTSFGGGAGYRASQRMRVGFEVDYVTRRSAIDAIRGFSGWRAGMSITYPVE